MKALIVVALGFVSLGGSQLPPAAPVGQTAPTVDGGQEVDEVAAHDNRTPAGRTIDGVLVLNLRAATGRWRPEGKDGRTLTVEAFGEEGGPLSAPAPLVRVNEGTELALSVRNELAHPLRVYGLCQRGGAACQPFDVAPGQVERVRFKAGTAGTYHYWATSTGMPQQFRASVDTQLSGALIVDPPGAAPDDRVLLITEWTSVTRETLHELIRLDDPGAGFLKLRPEAFFAINGRIWPHTERLRYRLDEPVRWRVINLTTQSHPMHLHGFYFDVNALGDGMSDRAFAPGQTPRVVTQVLQPGATMMMTWKPERAGNWLFHCHVMTHVSPYLHVDGTQKAGGSHHDHHTGAGMTGMVLGVTVDGPDDRWAATSGDTPARKVTLEMRAEPKRFGDAPAMAFALAPGSEHEAPANPQVPGPTLVLTRGEPVEITLVNKLAEGTAIHWHGMELESYYDGVHGWGGNGARVTPMIDPGGSFVVRFTPPRAGTFMYHTHLHDRTQLTSGLYGAMIVTEPEEPFDDTTDHVFVIGRGGPQLDSPVVINNSTQSQSVWKAATRHRIRLINITPDDIVSVSLQAGRSQAAWKPLTKDGAPVPPQLCVPTPAVQQIAVGETFDFEFDAPPGRAVLWLEVRSTGGRWLTQGRIIVR